MSSGAGYPIEEFLEAITAQLDQTQDALRLKAVNRPLTFALKDFNVDLQVFVEMDFNGRVTFRPAAPNEEGASRVSIGFTTITRPMIEENTISMEMAQAPTLDELGLENDDQRRLAKIGVRNAAQLRRLERDAGDMTLSRHTGVDLGRIKQALQMARPRIDDGIDLEALGPRLQPEDLSGSMPHSGRGGQQSPISSGTPEPYVDLDAGPVNNGSAPDLSDNVATPKPIRRQDQPVFGNGSDIGLEGEDRNPSHLGDRMQNQLPQGFRKPAKPTRRLNLRPDQTDFHLKGANLIEDGRAPRARLDGVELPLREANMQGVRFGLHDRPKAGFLEIELPDGSTQSFALNVNGEEQ